MCLTTEVSPMPHARCLVALWEARAGVSRTKILHSFGREGEIDREGVKRLVAALRILDAASPRSWDAVPRGRPATSRRRRLPVHDAPAA